MPEYLAPGVYVEEVSFRSKSIEGVGTSTTAFVGPTAFGPIGGSPEMLTSFSDYERIYGGADGLTFGDDKAAINHVAHAVRAYFNNGGGRLYVVRVFGGKSAEALATSKAEPFMGKKDDPAAKLAYFTARFPGQWLNDAKVVVRQIAQPVGGKDFLSKLPDGATLRVRTGADAALKHDVWTKVGGKIVRLKDDNSALEDVLEATQAGVTDAELLALNISVENNGVVIAEYPDVSLSKTHARYIGNVLSPDPKSRAEQLTQPIAIVIGDEAVPNTVSLLEGLVGEQPAAKAGQDVVEPGRRFSFAGGKDGTEPAAVNYETADRVAAGFDLLIGLEDVSIVAAPGYSSFDDAATIQDRLISHVEKPRRYRIAVLDAPPKKLPSEMRVERGKIDSTRAALYYPWVMVSNPLAAPDNNEPKEIALPPSGFVTGIYARSDVERGVWKAPANEVVRGALRFERDVNFGEQELLNPMGVNCLRYLSGRGYRVWGARTATSDPEWKYVNVRRYFNYLEASIDRGTQWAVFEPNGEMLWNNVRGTIGDFLYNEWKSGALLGSKAEEAYFVRCDRTTITQNDLDNGRLICLIGVAPLKPAEFVIFRIGQKTADAKN